MDQFEKRVGDQFDNIESLVVGIGHRLEAIASDTKVEVKRINGNVADLVRWRWFVTGGAAVVIFMVGVFGVALLGLWLTSSDGAAVTPEVDYDCSNFTSQDQAQQYLLKGDPYGLDGDHNGLACEALP